MEHLTKSQAASRSSLLRLQEDEERRLSKQLKRQKRQRTNLFKEALNVGDMKDSTLPRKGHLRVEDGGNGGDSGYMSLEREQIKEVLSNLVVGWMGGWVVGWMDGRMNGDGLMDRWTDGLMDVCHHHHHKV